MANNLKDAMKKCLADIFALHLKAWNYHWNVEGPDFHEYHSFFSDIYSGIQDEIDPFAEHIRAMGEYAPAGLTRYSELTTIKDELHVVPAEESVNRLLADNQTVLDSLSKCYKFAEKDGEIGISNFIQDRYDYHKKLAWMLRASQKNK